MKHPAKNLSLLSEHRLNAYTLAATAAGVGALCFAKPAEARIVYTPAHVAIKVNGGLFHIDLNHDGIPDFGLSNSWYQGEKDVFTLKAVHAQSANKILMTTTSKSCGVAAALPKGKRIGPTGHFATYPHGAWMAAYGPSSGCGVWFGKSDLQAYLGLEFAVKGKTHFGWARVKVDTLRRPFSAILTGYAYETIAGKPIIAGATMAPNKAASLGALAAGASGR